MSVIHSNVISMVWNSTVRSCGSNSLKSGLLFICFLFTHAIPIYPPIPWGGQRRNEGMWREMLFFFLPLLQMEFPNLSVDEYVQAVTKIIILLKKIKASVFSQGVPLNFRQKNVCLWADILTHRVSPEVLLTKCALPQETSASLCLAVQGWLSKSQEPDSLADTRPLS